MPTDAPANPWQTIILFLLQMFGAGILAFLGNKWLQRTQSREERRSRQFEDDMTWLETWLSTMTLCVDFMEDARAEDPFASVLRPRVMEKLIPLTPEADVRFVRIKGLNDTELNELIDEFVKISKALGIDDVGFDLEHLAKAGTDELLEQLRLVLLLAKLRVGQLRSQGPPS